MADVVQGEAPKKTKQLRVGTRLTTGEFCGFHGRSNYKLAMCTRYNNHVYLRYTCFIHFLIYIYVYIYIYMMQELMENH